jgi:peptide deformylase
MIETMRDGEGVGLAATQVHAAKRAFIIEVKSQNPRYPDRPSVPLMAIINPQIVERSSDMDEEWEGCLSIPDLRGRVPRWQSLKLSGLDRAGQPINLSASGFFARVIQHELDHLDGVVFLDRMTDFSTLTHLREFQTYWLNTAPPPGEPAK